MDGRFLGWEPPAGADTAAPAARMPPLMLAAHARWANLRAPAARLSAPCARSVVQTVPCTMLATGDHHDDVGRAESPAEAGASRPCCRRPGSAQRRCMALRAPRFSRFDRPVAAPAALPTGHARGQAIVEAALTAPTTAASAAESFSQRGTPSSTFTGMKIGLSTGPLCRLSAGSPPLRGPPGGPLRLPTR